MIYIGTFVSHKEEGSHVVCRRMDASGDNSIKWIWPILERQTYIFFLLVLPTFYMCICVTYNYVYIWDRKVEVKLSRGQRGLLRGGKGKKKNEE